MKLNMWWCSIRQYSLHLDVETKRLVFYVASQVNAESLPDNVDQAARRLVQLLERASKKSCGAQ